MLWSCKKADQTLQNSSDESVGSEILNGTRGEPGDGAWDVLGCGYDVTGDYANSSSSRLEIVDVGKMDLEHPTYVNSSGSRNRYSYFCC